MKKGVLRNFTKFTGKHLCQSLFSNKEHLWTTASINHGEINHNLYFYKYLRPGNSAIWHLSIIFVVVNESLI